ncbi:DUF6083 domain-containing protein [Streptomyces anthocyanicus]|uniref:DUF6083 domain-containing protein n=1 Tax=Streptomyces TaxID=1883 RepID=UPI00087D649D|nr:MULTISPECIES: DUF6083 domain-containing protein [unclassified Streptomyces]REH25803.1 hypothetical protein BX268_7801 [Streptomyces sp. 2221.1]SDT82232.1 hypothetical protein SAMN05428941_7792 [Streptomyces sp. 2114.2]
MCPNAAYTGRHWDGSPRTTRAHRPLRVAGTSPSRLLRCGQRARCRLCGNRIDVYPRSDQRPIALHPDELATAQIPEPCRWHLSCGIAHPHADGSAWCRIPHTVLCPSRTTPATTQLSPHVEAVRRQLAVRSRRLIDTGAFTPPAPSDPACQEQAADVRRPARPVVQLLLGRYLADRPLEEIRCVAQTRQRHRCSQMLLSSHTAAGRWRLLPAGLQRGQVALPAVLMAVYDLSRLPYAEQLRWRTQRCAVHAAASGAADLALAGWQVFDPLLHAEHIHTRLPHAAASRPREA